MGQKAEVGAVQDQQQGKSPGAVLRLIPLITKEVQPFSDQANRRRYLARAKARLDQGQHRPFKAAVLADALVPGEAVLGRALKRFEIHCGGYEKMS